MDANLGSIELVGTVKQCIDFDKLPVSDDMAAGSSCLFLDDGSCAKFHVGTMSWYLTQGGGGGGEYPEPSDNTATDKEVKDLLDNIFGTESDAAG